MPELLKASEHRMVRELQRVGARLSRPRRFPERISERSGRLQNKNRFLPLALRSTHLFVTARL
jgi:hypothetical protein